MRRTLVLVVAILMASVHVPAQKGSNAVSAITVAQERISREFKESELSPFTAVASRYFAAGEAARVATGAGGVTFGPTSGTGGVADIAFDGNEIWVTPV